MSDRSATLDLDLSGIHVSLTGPDDGALEMFRVEWAAWLGSPADQPDLRMEYRVSGEPPPDQTTLRKVLHTAHGDDSITFTTGEGKLELERSGHASATVTRGGDRFRFYGLQNLMLAALARVLPGRGIMVVHGAGILLDGTAVALIGPEDAGKTTWARIAAENGLTVLSDDLLFLGLDGEQAFALGSPFRSASTGPGRFPLGLLLSSEHAPEAAVRLCSRLAFQALLSANLPFSGDLIGKGTGLDRLLDGLLEAVPFRTLAFAPDPSFLDRIGESLARKFRE
ncbi:MAG: hypothetical protein IFK94_05970 [Acidobacteria bacterium]|uniref:HPr kinase/phosphorylase C-terminal domain-containing protein n=1 Tax=Candidatus Polarisedimenticola svalbardensis TaxID=2886004 RepID=A0A8J6Y1U5_9BACT|nr:hypothetical protein [Candidatus Polarisedimenticola svalbardensis]